MSGRLRKGRKRSSASSRWLQRQISDPFVKQARRDGYRSRAAYKLIDIDDRFALLRPGARIVDLGCAPGGWTQVAVARANADGARPGHPRGHVIGLDLIATEPITGAHIVTGDFRDPTCPETLLGCLNGKADLVMSDMAMPATGHRATDHLRIMALCEAVADLTQDILRQGGSLICKLLAGGAQADLHARLKSDFAKVAYVKPAASRSDSRETYLVARAYRGDVPTSAGTMPTTTRSPSNPNGVTER